MKTIFFLLLLPFAAFSNSTLPIFESVQNQAVVSANLPTAHSLVDNTCLYSDICNDIDMPVAVKINWARLRRDLSGAGSGASIGGYIGGVGGAIIGAVIGGCIGSAGEMPVVEPTNPTSSPTFGSVSNSTNPFDGIGVAHYQAMDELLANPTGKLTQSGQVNTTNFHAWARQFIVSKGLGTDAQVQQSYPLSTMVQEYNTLNSSSSFAEDVNRMLESGRITQQDANVLNSYGTTLENSRDLASFVAYSIQTENGIANSTAYSENSKRILLISMATARYGAAYWGIFN